MLDAVECPIVSVELRVSRDLSTTTPSPVQLEVPAFTAPIPQATFDAAAASCLERLNEFRRHDRGHRPHLGIFGQVDDFVRF